MLEFGRNRFDRGLEMGKAIAQSTTLNEAIDLQASYTRSIVFRDYVSEAQKIADLGTRSLLDSMTTLRQQAGRQTREMVAHVTAAE